MLYKPDNHDLYHLKQEDMFPLLISHAKNFTVTSLPTKIK